ncbi:uncharacterized protein LY89DRAFT_678953 [Mollisia scopiformis]|uniref:Uncharacterized protein n=1 Tax=Mollisia scopiformis TaxID=149040 RepID=A0A132B1G9_MOLSC|nr:uncharacterized protein LY89DRAFT_678953 [Mollisia scopiformis]KUJ06226.1 hypothetical protein LY89DRAFT_678953 [Mollisia scopiformis]
MSDLPSHFDATLSERETSSDFIPNPDAIEYRFGSSDTLVAQLVKELPVTITVEKGHVCKHKDQSYGVGFKVNSVESGVFQIQVYDRSFDIELDALGASWTGRWVLFRHWHWIRLLRAFLAHREVAGFHVEYEGRGWYIIRGSCCFHATKVSRAELEECWPREPAIPRKSSYVVARKSTFFSSSFSHDTLYSRTDRSAFAPEGN